MQIEIIYDLNKINSKLQNYEAETCLQNNRW